MIVWAPPAFSAAHNTIITCFFFFFFIISLSEKGFFPPFFFFSIIIIPSSTSLPATKTAHCRRGGNRIGRLFHVTKTHKKGRLKKKTKILRALISGETSCNGFILARNRMYRHTIQNDCSLFYSRINLLVIIRE